MSAILQNNALFVTNANILPNMCLCGLIFKGPWYIFIKIA